MGGQRAPLNTRHGGQGPAGQPGTGTSNGRKGTSAVRQTERPLPGHNVGLLAGCLLVAAGSCASAALRSADGMEAPASAGPPPLSLMLGGDG